MPPGLLYLENTIGEYTNISTQDFRDRRREIDDYFLATMRGTYTEHDYLQLLLHGTDWGLSPANLITIIRRNFDRDFEDNAIQIVQDLKDTGQYRLVLFSDHVREWIEYIWQTRSELLEMFDERLFSFDFNGVKSDPGTFREALNKLDVKAAHCIFIDDRPVNIEAAQIAGINTITYTGSSALRQQLANEYGIHV